MVTNKPGAPGRPRISRSPFAQGGPGCPGRTCGSCPVHFFPHGGRGCRQTPGLPCTLELQRVCDEDQPGRRRAAGMMGRVPMRTVCPMFDESEARRCCAAHRRYCERSEAIQTPACGPGLLRFARNDVEGALLNTGCHRSRKRTIRYSRGDCDSAERPRRTGYPAFAGYDGGGWGGGTGPGLEGAGAQYVTFPDPYSALRGPGIPVKSSAEDASATNRQRFCRTVFVFSKKGWQC
jgi:hypothetical protein